MICQFEAEKCLHAASTDNLALMIIGNRPDPRAIQTVQIPEPGLKVGAKPRRLPGGGCWHLELTDALLYIVKNIPIFTVDFFILLLYYYFTD